eukprot:5148923-Karenia_brevis.AAC.1
MHASTTDNGSSVRDAISVDVTKFSDPNAVRAYKHLIAQAQPPPSGMHPEYATQYVVACHKEAAEIAFPVQK